MPDKINSKDCLLYSSCSSLKLKKFDFNGECVFYDARSGETHFLNFSGFQILNVLTESPVSLNQLLAREDLKCSPNGEPLKGKQFDNILFLLNRLIELGIVVCAPAPRSA